MKVGGVVLVSVVLVVEERGFAKVGEGENTAGTRQGDWNALVLLSGMVGLVVVGTRGFVEVGGR